MGVAIGSSLVILLAALAWPLWFSSWAGLREAAVAGLALPGLAGVFAFARDGHMGRGRIAVTKVLERLGVRALEITVNNASTLSSFARVDSSLKRAVVHPGPFARRAGAERLDQVRSKGTQQCVRPTTQSGKRCLALVRMTGQRTQRSQSWATADRRHLRHDDFRFPQKIRINP